MGRYRYKKNRFRGLRRYLSRKSYRYRNNYFIHGIIRLFCLALIIVLMLNYLKGYKRDIDKFNYDLNQVTSFLVDDNFLRDLREYSDEKKKDFYDLLVAAMVQSDFELLDLDSAIIRQLKPLKSTFDVKYLKKIYTMILEDLVYFPIPENLNANQHGYFFTDTWRAERTYGGDREHYGTDIMDELNTRGYFPIMSITDGEIEKIGWLEKGGYRIGIRAPSGAYFYYAHLYDYADGIKEGDKVKAGQLIGFMGDSGYGKNEGTVGQFDVHLHLGISLPLKSKNDETWINPYWILRYLEDNKIKSWY